jgi:hypothetical protein
VGDDAIARVPSESNESAGIRVNDCAPVLMATQWIEPPFNPMLSRWRHSSASVQDIRAFPGMAKPCHPLRQRFCCGCVLGTVVAGECIQFFAERAL